MRKRQVDIQFPLGGLDRSAAHQKQAPFTCVDLQNVRAIDTIENRERGGSRPGLIQSHIDDLGHEVRMLTSMTLALGDGFTAWSDTFDGTAMSDMWAQASWASSLPLILSSVPAASVDTTVSEGEAVLDALTIDATKAYTVEALIVPHAGAFHGKYRLYLRLDDTTPDISTAGVVVELVATGAVGAFSGTVTSVVGGVPTATELTVPSPAFTLSSPGWLSATVSGATVTVYWRGETVATITAGAQTGKRVGFGMECTEAGGLCLTNVFRVQYYSTGTVNPLRSMLIASAGGDLFYESTYGRLTQLSTSLTLEDDSPLCSAQEGQSLYIADFGDVAATGDDGTVSGTTFDDGAGTNWVTAGVSADDMVVVVSNAQGTAIEGTYKIQTVASGSITLTTAAGAGACSYRIERAPKIYDPLANSLTLMSATTGQVPTGCPLICRFMDRIVIAGAEVAPHVWYMSRQGDPLDWDYSQEDAQRAVAGTSSPAGVPGSAIIALAPHSDDYLIMGCRDSLWRLRGDPANEGQLDALSHEIGIIGQRAWCLTPDGVLIFLSMDGLYALAAGGDTFPSALSRDVIPRELMNLNPDTVTPSLEYDIKGRGVHIFLTSSSSASRSHWWFDWKRKTFWLVAIDSDFEPTATCSLQSTVIEESGVILGGRDGKLRKFHDLAADDCGVAFTSYVHMGPFYLGPLSTVNHRQDDRMGTLSELSAVMAEGSGDVTWSLCPSDTFEGAAVADYTSTGTWSEGLNATVYPAARGNACVLKLTGTGTRWAAEHFVATLKEAGQRRIS